MQYLTKYSIQVSIISIKEKQNFNLSSGKTVSKLIALLQILSIVEIKSFFKLTMIKLILIP